MYATLINDNIPALAEAEGKNLPYVVAQNDEIFFELLKERLAEATSAFLQDNTFESLAATLIVLQAITEFNPEVFEKLYDETFKTFGGYKNRYMLVQQPPMPSETEEEALDEVPDDASGDEESVNG